MREIYEFQPSQAWWKRSELKLHNAGPRAKKGESKAQTFLEKEKCIKLNTLIWHEQCLLKRERRVEKIDANFYCAVCEVKECKLRKS